MSVHLNCGGLVSSYHDGYTHVLYCERCNTELDEADVKEETWEKGDDYETEGFT
jgi:hypothetical protein